MRCLVALIGTARHVLSSHCRRRSAPDNGYCDTYLAWRIANEEDRTGGCCGGIRSAFVDCGRTRPNRHRHGCTARHAVNPRRRKSRWPRDARHARFSDESPVSSSTSDAVTGAPSNEARLYGAGPTLRGCAFQLYRSVMITNSLLEAARSFGGVIGGSLLGATVSAVVTVLVQRRNLAEARRIKAEDRLLADQAKAQSVFIKLEALHRDLASLAKHLDQAFSRLHLVESPKQAWQTLRSLASPPAPEAIAATELTVLLAHREHDLFSRVTLIYPRFRAIAEGLAQAAKMRAEILAIFEPDGSVSGRIASGTAHVDGRMRLRMLEFHDLAEGLWTQALADETAAFAVLDDFAGFMRDKLQTTIRIHRMDVVSPCVSHSDE